SLAKTDFSKSKSVTTNNVSNDFSKPVTTQIIPQNVKSILKNTNVIALGMYKVHTKPNQTRTPQLPQDIRRTNKRVSFSTGVIPTTSVSRPHLKSNRLEYRVMHSNSKGKKRQVEDHRNESRTIDILEPMAPKCSTLSNAPLSSNSFAARSRGTDLYSITLQDTSTPNPICLMAKATSSQACLMFNELLNGTTLVVSKSFTITATDAPNQRQQQHTTPSTLTNVAANTPPLNIQTTPETASQAPTQAPTVIANENINQTKTNKENAQVEDDEYINIFSTPVQELSETSSLHVDSSNMHTIYQRHPSKHRWTKDNPLEQIIRNPSQSIRIRR
ncbi:hypothetical protein Tco_0524831, partial [Tanacetum coccineum]